MMSRVPKEPAEDSLTKDGDPAVGLVDESCLTVSIPNSVNAVLPLRIRWHLPEGSHVVKSQVIAHLSGLQGEYETPNSDGSNKTTSSIDEECSSDTISVSGQSSHQSEAPSNTILIRSPATGILKHFAVPNQGIVRDCNIPLAYLESKECNHPLVVRGMCAICMASLHEDDVLDGTVHAGFVLDLDNTLLHATSTPPRTQVATTILLDDFDRQCGQRHRNNHSVMGCKIRESQGRPSPVMSGEHLEPVHEEEKALTSLKPDLEQHPLQSDLAGRTTESGDADSDVTTLKVGALSQTEFVVGSPPPIITWEAACFPTFSHKESTQRSFQEKVYPHYRTDDEARRVIASLEQSVIACRVSAVLDDGPVGPYSSLHMTYFKLRPGVIDFLREMSQYFELYLYTMGTATHAQTALRLLDPQRRFFGGRVFSRGDAVQGLKSAHRIFPYDRKMVLVVDDLEYMWHHVASCIKVNGYFFFEDTKAADLSRLTPENYTQWLSTARPYCNFLHSDPSDSKERRQGDKHCSQKDGQNLNSGQPKEQARCEPTHHNAEAHSTDDVTSSNDSKKVKEESSGSNQSEKRIGNPGAAVSQLPSSFGESVPTIRPGAEGSKRVLDVDGFTMPSTIKRICGLRRQRCDHRQSDKSDKEERCVHGQSNKKESQAGDKACSVDPPNSEAVEGPHAPTFFTSTVLRDSDQQLLYLAQILKGIHKLYFKASARLIRAYRMSTRRDRGMPDSCKSSSEDEAEIQNGRALDVNGAALQIDVPADASEMAVKPSNHSNHCTQEGMQQGKCDVLDFNLLEHLPDVAWVLQAFREQALKGVHISSTGLQGRHLPRFSRTDLGRMAVRLGACVSDTFDSSCTHLVSSKLTDKFAKAGKMGIHRVHVMWLEKAIYTWRRPCESAFDFRKCEGVYRSCWEPPEPHNTASDDIYKEVIETVNRHIKSIQRDTCEKLQANHMCDSNVHPQLGKGGQLLSHSNTSPVKYSDKAASGGLTEEEISEWDALWEEGFGGIQDDKSCDAEAAQGS